jgi:hypothetical protein
MWLSLEPFKILQGHTYFFLSSGDRHTILVFPALTRQII